MNQIHFKSSENMDEVPDESVSLVITSPPYNVGKKYATHDDDMDFVLYLALMRRIFRECYKKVRPGGRVAVNVANTGRRPYKPMSAHFHNILTESGFLARAEIIWQKGKAANQTSWGSYLSPSAPFHRDMHEYILLYQKGEIPLTGRKEDITITKEEFLEYTGSIWFMLPAGTRDRKIHPTCFPIELPSRLIKLYTYTGDVVLDPFMGIGTTLAAANRLQRNGIGYEVSEEYCIHAALEVL